MRVSMVMGLMVLFAFPASIASESGADHVHGGKAAAGSPEGPGSRPIRKQESDSAFARASLWDSATAEVLYYSVKRAGAGGGPGREVDATEGDPGGGNGSWGSLITAGAYLSPDGAARRKPSGKEDHGILNAVLAASWTESGLHYSRNVAVKLPRRGPFVLLRQDESMQTPSGATHRVWDGRGNPPRFRILSAGREATADSVSGHWPLHTEEMLFTYVRALPKRAGYREEIWMADGGAKEDSPPRIRFATLSVRGKMAGIREVDTWHITLDREGGPRSEFWTSQSGLHPVVMAILADGSEWALRRISRKRIPDR